MLRLGEVRGLLVEQRLFLVQRVVVAGEIGQVLLEKADDLWRFGTVEEVPVLGIDRVARREILLRLDDQPREAGLGVNVDDPHAEERRLPVVRVEIHERLVDRGRVFVTQFLEVELGQVAVDLVGVTAVAVVREILVEHLGPAEVGETQADDAERIGKTVLVALLVLGVEVVADRQAMIEHRHVAMQRLFVEFLLVERPALLVQGELVIV